MLYIAKIKLTTPVLAAQATSDCIRKFKRIGDGISFDPVLWGWLLENAAAGCHLDDVDLECIRPPSELVVNRIEIYNRRWDNKSEKFESIKAGSLLDLPLMLTTRHPHSTSSATIPPDLAILRQLLEFMGARLGISPWGSKFNYGRFNVISITEK